MTSFFAFVVYFLRLQHLALIFLIRSLILEDINRQIWTRRLMQTIDMKAISKAANDLIIYFDSSSSQYPFASLKHVSAYKSNIVMISLKTSIRNN